MATPKAAWGIEIGAHAIKALRLERNGDGVAVSDFAVIPHKKVLTTPDLDQDEMVRLGLGQFISQKNLEGEHLVMSVPGHSAFARFAKLPPVEPKKVPDIVKFEAVQQIPFPIDEVEWDYQTFTSEETPEIEVGIFAITRERVQQRLGLYAELGMSPETMTLSPVAVYNAMNHDLSSGGKKHKGPTVFIDIGTSATDVIVAEAGRCWIRTFPLGGTHFTEAIASAFKLSYSKAEKLKLEASDSKYAKQIMQAMRPVFSDLLQDLQRSIGYYQSLHRDSKLTTMVGIGSTFKIPGLRKFLGQQLQIDVVRLDEYKRIAVKGREAASFAENAVNMATAYGLALQGVGLAQIDANLVPVKSLREQMWHSKTKWFAAAAAIAIIGAGMTLYRPLVDRGLLEPVIPAEVNDVITLGNRLRSQFDQMKSASDVGATATNMLSLLDYRTVWPYLLNDSANALAAAEPQPELLGDKIELILGIDPKQRRLVQLEKLEGKYIPPASAAPAEGQPSAVAGQKSRMIEVTLNVELSHDRPIEFLNDTVEQWLRDHAEPTGARANVPYRIIAASIDTNPGQLQEIEVLDTGLSVKEQAEPDKGGAPQRTKPAPPPPPSGGAAPPTSPGSGPMWGSRPAPPVQAPPGAPRGGLGGTGTGGGNAPGAPTAKPPLTTGRQPGSPIYGEDEPQVTAEIKNLNEMAPVPSKPSLYPAKSTFFRVPITFQVELIDPVTTPAPESVAQAS
ncbi:MAG: type IV pilus assembly protein PilM [Phycisphaerales bacterium]|nr:type IV pilus assembly protein PilM [Phycisphaerales bacterium]